MPANPIKLLGLTFDDLSLTEILGALLERPRAAHFAYLVTPNADHFARLNRQPQWQILYQAAWLCVLDSRLIHRLAGAIFLPTPQAVPGADITRALLATLSPQTIAVIGMSAATISRLQARYKHLHVIHHEPPPNLLGNDLALRRARDFATSTNARFTFIALGSPLQEMLAYEIARQPTATGTGLCIGSALEFCAGTLPRAPYFMRSTGLEWLFRLATEPKRLWRRYLLADPPVLWALLRQKARQSWRAQPLPAAPAAISAPGPYRPERRARLQKTPDAPSPSSPAPAPPPGIPANSDVHPGSQF
jgi:exopolysaccharide biosynthesis WecB/TagA/CpsF family protein